MFRLPRLPRVSFPSVFVLVREEGSRNGKDDCFCVEQLAGKASRRSVFPSIPSGRSSPQSSVPSQLTMSSILTSDAGRFDRKRVLNGQVAVVD